MKRRSFSQVFSGFLLIFLTLLSFAAGAARLEMDRNELAIGELTTVHLKGAPFIALVDWKVSEELAIIVSDSKHIQVRGVRAGSGTITCEMNLSVHSVNITVRAAAPVQTTLPTPAYAAPVYTAPSYPAPVPAAVGAASSLAGTWQLNANGYTGKLELSGSMLSGRVWFDTHATWESLKELYFDDAIGELSFTRPGANQTYRGRLQGNTLEGRFTQWSGRDYTANPPSYGWSATRPGAAVKPAPTPGAYPASAGESGSLRLTRDRYAPGEAIVVDFTAPGSYAANAWVGIIPSQVPHGSEAENDRHDLTYQYLQKRTSGSLTFTAPTAPGNYDLRLHDTDNNGREVASVSFQVGTLVSPDSGRGYTAQPPATTQSGAPATDDSLKDVMNQLKGVFGR